MALEHVAAAITKQPAGIDEQETPKSKRQAEQNVSVP